jgi:cell wall-associated NlpC family hydrolase
MNGTMRAMSLWREKFEGLKKEEQFKNLALLYYSAPYEWGHEIPLGTDCSGLICGPLILMGHEVRVTADQIMKNMTSAVVASSNLIFFVKDGKAGHCGIYIGSHAMIHASGERGVVIESTEIVEEEYRLKGYTSIYRELDFDKVEANRGIIYDLDTDLH